MREDILGMFVGTNAMVWGIILIIFIDSENPPEYSFQFPGMTPRNFQSCKDQDQSPLGSQFSISSSAVLVCLIPWTTSIG